jgi:amino acid transporter
MLLDSFVMSQTLKSAQGKLRLVPLIAATYFMVSGGPYGIEDILGCAGYGWAIAILLVLPILWSLPTALMIGELASAIPAEGGFYVWVRRALGPFWGFQESWLSLSASIFDMALYSLPDGRVTSGHLRLSPFAACGTFAVRRPWARAPSGYSRSSCRLSSSLLPWAFGVAYNSIPRCNGATRPRCTQRDSALAPPFPRQFW